MKNRWSDGEARASVRRYAKQGVGRDVALRVYTSRLLGGEPALVLHGGKKLPEADALAMAYKAVDQGAAGVDMGRNIFQSDCPVAMIQAVGAVVHKLEKPAQALDMDKTLKAKIEAKAKKAKKTKGKAKK